MNIYNTVPAAHLKRTMFHWKCPNKHSQDFAAILPFFFRECLPGDVWKLNLSAFIRVQPMVAAPMTPIRFYSQFWFCPTRVLMQRFYPSIVDAWATFIFGGPNGDGKNEAGQTPTLPIWIPNASGVKLEGINSVLGVQSRKTGNADAKGSLWDAFGYPVNAGYHNLNNSGVDGSNQDFSAWCPLAFPKIMYNLIWNEFFRNENLESSVSLMSDDVQLCKWRHDYFMSALPFPQRGPTVALPLSGIGGIQFTNGITGINGIVPSSTVGVLKNDQTALYSEAFYQTATSSSPSIPSVGTQADVQNWSNNNLLFDSKARTSPNVSVSSVSKAQLDSTLPYVDFSQAATSDISDLRLIFQTQKFMERAARGGVRYVEGLKSFFGTSPNNDALQLPVFVGGMKQNIIVSEVLQTSQTATTPQGNIAGRGISAGGDNIGVLSCREHGYLMGLCWIRPDLEYISQGIHREMLHRSRYDFYWPQFAHLSERIIYKAELFASPSTMTPAQMGAGSGGMLGYTGMYNEYRSGTAMITGEMRDTFAYWHLGRSFSSAPTLNSDYITCFPRKDIFAVKNEDPFMLDLLTEVKVYRPLPLESNPGLIDHM